MRLNATCWMWQKGSSKERMSKTGATPDSFTASSAEKQALITPVEWLVPGHGLLCRDCRYHRVGKPYHKMHDPTVKEDHLCTLPQCNKVLYPERGHPGLVLHKAGNETCYDYEPEIVLQFVWNPAIPASVGGG